MLYKYIYNGAEYTTEYAVRQALFEAERKAVPVAPSTYSELQEFWASFGVEVVEVPEPQQTLEEAKAEKSLENDNKAEKARESQAFTVTIDGTELSFITDRKTQMDLQTALMFLQAGQQSYTWIDEQGVTFDFSTTQQIITVSNAFMQRANVYPTWLFYKTQIDEATTVEEVRAIVIDYGINLEA